MKRLRIFSETRGFRKVIIDAHSDRILGFAALGPEAGELMSKVQVAMLAQQPYTHCEMRCSRTRQ